MDKGYSTLVGTERRLAPVVLGVHFLCIIAGLYMLWQGFLSVPAPAIALCTCAWLFLTGSNVFYTLRHSRPSVGMIPISIASLGPASFPAVLAQNIKSALKTFAIASCIAAIITIVIMAIWFSRLRAVYAHSPAPPNNAVVIVLGGAIKQGEPCKTLALRLQTATHVWQKHPDASFVLTGGIPAGESMSEAAAMARVLQDLGVPPCSLHREEHACNTEENLSLSFELMHNAKLRGRPCVLSSDYHLYRSVQIGKSLGVDLIPIPAPTPRGSWLQQWCREVLTLLAKR